MSAGAQASARNANASSDANTQPLRLFIALPCPINPAIAAAFDQLAAAQNSDNSGIRCVDPATLHITLKFLGSVAGAQVRDVQAALDAALRGLTAPTLTLHGAGKFPGALWLGVDDNPGLTHIAQRCDSAMAALGFAPERRRYHPHVTLARMKRKATFDADGWAREHSAKHWGQFDARTVHLYRSDTHPDGARYSVIHAVPLDWRE